MAGPERLNMADGSSVEQGPTLATAQAVETPKGASPLYRSPAFDPNRKDYLPITIGNRISYVDPLTGKEVAGSPRVEGGAGAEVVTKAEFESSPEHGMMLVELIVRMETKMSYEQRYNETNEPTLNGAYEALRKFVEGDQEHRYDRSPFDIRKGRPKVELQPNESLSKAIIRTYKEKIAQGVGRAKQEAKQPPEDFTGVGELNVLIARFKDENTPAAEIPKAKEDLLKYFNEARRKGLLVGIDEVFNSLYLALTNPSIQRDRIRQLLYEKTTLGATPNIPEAYLAGASAFRRKRADDEVNPRLQNVWDAYIIWTRDRFEAILDGQDTGVYERGEWRPPTEKDDTGIRETYWEPSPNYPKYYMITANTPTQFRTAKETFLRMIKNKALGYAPDELMQHFLNFRDNLCARAEDLATRQTKQLEGPEKMTTDFVIELRQEFEALAFVWGADYNNEVYNKEGWKQFMMAMALHEGPQRWTRLIRSGEGQVGAHTWRLDYDKIVELAYHAQGSRGQLGSNSVAQNYLRETIKEILVGWGVGVVLKDYDPRDPYLGGIDTDASEARWSRAVRLHQIEQHLERNNYELESLTEDEQKEYQEVKKFLRDNQEFIGLHNSEEEVKSLYEGFDNGDAHLMNFQRYGIGLNQDQLQAALDRLPPALRESVVIGKVQYEINRFRQEVRKLQVPLKRGEKLIDELAKLKNPDGTFRITKKEKRTYLDVLAISQHNFDVAFQMQGATHEKAVRGGAVLFVYRNSFVQEYLKVRRTNDAELSLQERQSRWSRNQHLGWILYEHNKKGKSLETFTQEERQFYQNLTEQQRKYYVDNVPYHQAVKFIMAGVNWTKMYYADDNAAIWQRPDLAAMIDAKDDKGNYKNKNFRAVFRNAVIEKLTEKAADQLWVNGFQATLNYVDFEVVSFDPKTKKIQIKPKANPQTKNVDVKPMAIKVPTGTINTNGKMVVQTIGEKHLNWDTAVDSYLALHTTHTYWAYQNNNTHTLIPEYVFQQARDIRDGKLRWEDADIFAGLLLTVDPALCRVKSFPGDQMSMETTVFDAAVEDSFLGFIHSRNAIKSRFLPQDGNLEDIGMGYFIEDFGGEGRFALQLEAAVAKMTKRWARRFAAALGKSKTPQHASSMADNIGRKGVTGAVSTMADKIVDLSGQRIFSQFGITKFINLTDADSELWASLVGYVDPKEGSVEGVFEKPTNNNDRLVKAWKRLHSIRRYPDALNDFLYELRESFGRMEKTLRIIRKMYSDGRNASGALDLSETDIFLPDGRFNPEITNDRNTGTSRHIARMFWDAYVDWLLDTGPGGGVETYGESAAFYKFLREPYLIYKDGRVMKDPSGRTWAGFLFDKMAR